VAQTPPAVPPLRPLAASFERTRIALHQLAERIIAPARKPHEEIALRHTAGGYGTPVFEFEGIACQVRMEGPELVVRRGDDERRARVKTLAEAAELVGEDLLPEGTPMETAPLDIDPEDAAQLGAWFGLARAALAELRLPWDGDGAMDPSPMQLWPEHFDIAIEAGPAAEGRRANYAASPGDEHHPEPYLYVGPWTAAVEGELWQAQGFTGAELRYSELLGAADQPAAALQFFRTRQAALDEEGRG
jgi:hypothetical protein